MEWKQLEKTEDGKHYLVPVIEFEAIDNLPVDPFRYRMFHFTPEETYGESYTVLAKDSEEAHGYLMKWFDSRVEDKWFWDQEAENWRDVIIEDENTYKKDCTLKVYEEGEVLHTEAC